MSALFIILVSLKMTLFCEKILISNRCISGLMSSLIKKSWTVSTVQHSNQCDRSIQLCQIAYKRNLRPGICVIYFLLLRLAVMKYFGAKNALALAKYLANATYSQNQKFIRQGPSVLTSDNTTAGLVNALSM